MPKPANSGPVTDLQAFILSLDWYNDHPGKLLLQILRRRGYNVKKDQWTAGEPAQQHDGHAPSQQATPDQQQQASGAGQSIALGDDCTHI